MSKIIVSLSGGMDSATLLYHVYSTTGERERMKAVSFQYPSKHNAHELSTAMILAEGLGVEHDIIDLYPVFNAISGSSLLFSGGPVPDGHYNEETMKQTVVPGRNLIFTSILAALAEGKEGLGEVWLGVHAGDHHIYPDCRPAFLSSAREAVEHSSDYKVNLCYPFMHKTKDEIVRRGLELGVPFQHTRTCYKDQPVACGKCGSCQERLEAFSLNGVEDPLPYESRELFPKPKN